MLPDKGLANKKHSQNCKYHVPWEMMPPMSPISTRVPQSIEYLAYVQYLLDEQTLLFKDTD